MTVDDQHGDAIDRGVGLRRATWATVGVLVVLSAIGLVSSTGRIVAAVVSSTMFLAGCGTFLWAYAIAVGRSRAEEIGVGGLFFLAGDIAPPRVRRSFLGALAAQLAVAIAAGVARPYTPLAFVVLAPMLGLGLSGLWGARHGRFGARALTVGRPGRSAGASVDDDLRVVGDLSDERLDGLGDERLGDKDRPDHAPPGTVASAHEPPDMEQNVPHG